MTDKKICDIRWRVEGLLAERDLAQKNNDIYGKSVDEVQDDWEEAVKKWFKKYLEVVSGK